MQRVEQSIRVDAPVEECLNIWTREDFFPHFVSTDGSEATSKKSVKRLQWQELSVDTEQSEKTLWWHQVEDNNVDTSGIVTFRESDDAQTDIIVTLTCNCAFDEKGEFVTKAFQNPQAVLESVLIKFQRTMTEQKPAASRS